MALIPNVPPENFTVSHVYIILLRLIKTVSVISLMFAVAAIIWGGLVMISSGGNEEKTKQGKNIVSYALIGLVIILFGWVAVNQTLRIIDVKCPYASIDEINKLAGGDAEAKNAVAQSALANPDCNERFGAELRALITTP